MARHWGDELDDYWKGTIWQRIAQDRQIWKQHAEAFARPRDTTDDDDDDNDDDDDDDDNDDDDDDDDDIYNNRLVYINRHPLM